jgi:hypothetical protein
LNLLLYYLKVHLGTNRGFEIMIGDRNKIIYKKILLSYLEFYRVLFLSSEGLKLFLWIVLK